LILAGGTTAFLAAIVLGPRRGRFYDDDGNPLEVPASWPPHSVGLQVLGTFILWFGWYGFNPGSALLISSVTQAKVASLAAVTTTLAAASGCVTCMFVDSFLDASKTGEVSYDLTCAMNGALSGLVAVTAGCATVAPWCALMIGAVGGVVYLIFSKMLIKLRIDDAVDAIPVHLGNGIWGLVAAGLFSTEENMGNAGYKTDHIGWFFEWGRGSVNANLLLAQFVAVLWIIGFVGIVMGIFFVILNKLNLFRKLSDTYFS
jgi:ammonium transporter, Amt family